MLKVYYITLATRHTVIEKQGVTPRMSPLRPGFWHPKGHVIYLADSIKTAKQYADKAYFMRYTDAKAWDVYEVVYEEFPPDMHGDYEWGIPGVFYITVPIARENLRFIETYYAVKVERVRR